MNIDEKVEQRIKCLLDLARGEGYTSSRITQKADSGMFTLFNSSNEEEFISFIQEAVLRSNGRGADEFVNAATPVLDSNSGKYLSLTERRNKYAIETGLSVSTIIRRENEGARQIAWHNAHIDDPRQYTHDLEKEVIRLRAIIEAQARKLRETRDLVRLIRS